MAEERSEGATTEGPSPLGPSIYKLGCPATHNI
jgi:hypothetical protein